MSTCTLPTSSNISVPPSSLYVEEDKRPRWKIVFNLRSRGSFASFKEAARKCCFLAFKMLQNRKTSIQTIETYLVIETPSGCTLCFHDVRNICIEAGWLEESGWSG